MRALSQIKLLLWKNVLLRIRYPAVIALEVLWPILILGIIALMRTASPPFKKSDCHYHPRSMPSAGAVSFLQTFVCNMDNKCYKSETHVMNTLETARSFSALSEELGPYFASDETLDIFEISNQSVVVLNTMKTVIGDKELMNGLEQVMNFSSYFRDPDKVKDILVNDQKLLSQDSADALMASNLDVGNLLKLTGTPDLRDIVCDPNKLQSFIKFPTGSNVVEISRSLCNINDSEISNLSNTVIRQLNVSTIFKALQLFEEVKGKLGGSSLSLIFEEIAQMFELVMTSESLVGFLTDFAAIPDIADLIRKIPTWVDGIADLNGAILVIKDVLFSLDPLMTNLGLDNSSAWLVAKNAVYMGLNFVKLGEGQWNGTSEEFIQPMTELIKNVEQLAKEEGGKQLIAVLTFFSQIDYLNIYDQIMTSQLSEKTVLDLLQSFEVMMKQLPGWMTVQDIARIFEHTLDMMSIFTEKSIELKHALKNLFDANQVLTSELNRLFQYGPTATKALLEGFTKTSFWADVMVNVSSYQTVCEDVMTEVKSKVPYDVYTDMHDTLCAGDVMEAFNSLMETMKLSEITNVVNSTVMDIVHLYNGDFWGQYVPFPSLYYHYVRFTTAIDNYLYDDFTWAEVFQSLTADMINLNEAGWEPVTDMLDENFLTTGLLGLYQGFGQVLVGSEISDDISPLVNMMSQLMKMIYDTMNDYTKSYSSDSPIVMALKMVTTYMPEMITGITYLWDNNMAAIYHLTSSSDPLATFCNESYLSQMMPANVPVNEMHDLICYTNWTVAINDLSQPAMDTEKMINMMTEILTINTTASYDIEMDWINMVDYSERIMDMLNSGDLANADFTMGYMAFFDSINFTKLGEGIDVLFKELGEMDNQDIEKLMAMSFRIMEGIDKTDASLEWQEVKTYLAYFDAYLDLQIIMTESIQDANSLQSLISTYPPQLRHIMVLLADAYPQFVRALGNILRQPEKLLDKLIKDGFQAPDCKTHFVSDYTLLPTDSAVHKLERFICDLNMTELTNSWMTSQPEVDEFSRKVSELITNPGIPITVNWTLLIEKTNIFIEQLSSSTIAIDDSFDLTPFNLTAIDLSWEEFYKAAATIENFDMERIQEVGFKIQDLVTQMVGGDAEIGAVLYSSLYVTHHFTKMLNTELVFFNTSSEVVLSEYLWSNELGKLFNLLTKSPDVNAVGVATIQRLLTSPEKALISMDFDGLCSDVDLFSKVFVVEASSLSPATLQKTVCDLNIDFNLVLDQVQNNRPSVKEFIDAIMVLSSGNITEDDINVGTDTVVKEVDLLSRLITDIITNPPVIKLTPTENWMNMTLYSQAWEKLGNKLNALGHDLQNTSKMIQWESSMAKIVFTTVEEIPGADQVLGIIDMLLDMMQMQLEQSNGNVDILRKYPNSNKVLELVQQAPDAVQTIMYTVLTQPVKTARWGEALMSWTAFCATPTNSIMSVPPDLNFDMGLFLAKACSIDIDELMKEFTSYQSIDTFETVLTNGTFQTVNSSVVLSKFDKFISSIFEPADMENNAFDRVFSESVWQEIGNRVTVWSDKTMEDFSLISGSISGVILEMAEIVFGQMATDVIEIYQKALAVTDLLLNQILIMLDRKDLNEAFMNLPSLQTIAGLLNELPELYETVLYTGMFHSDKISEGIPQITSFESFCANGENLLVVPPNSPFDLKDWMARLCSINITEMVDEVGNYSVAKEMDRIISGPYQGNVSVESVIDSLEKLMTRINNGVDVNDRVFDPSAWDQVMARIDNFQSPTGQDLLTQLSSVVASSLVSTLQQFPDGQAALEYIDAFLDFMQTQLDQMTGGFGDLRKHPNSNTLLELLNSLPEALQTVLYTVMTQPTKTAKWGEALQSWTAFCNTPTSEIMSVPRGLNFDMTVYLGELCNLNFTALGEELSTSQGVRKLDNLIANGPEFKLTYPGLEDRMTKFIKSLVDFASSPIDIGDESFNKLFNVTLWEEIGGRINVWSNKSMDNFGTPEKITEVIQEILLIAFGNTASDYTEIYDKVIAVTDIILDQIMVIIDSKSLNSSFHDLPSMQLIAGLLDELPELYETVLYTSIYHPEKLTMKASSFESLEAFCLNNPQDMFSIAPNSPFKLEAWLQRFCTINVTQLVEELGQYGTVKQIDQVISGPYSGPVDIGSVISKAEKLIAKLNEGLEVNERFANPNVWDQVMTRVNTWIWPYSDVSNFLKDEQKRLMRSLIAYVENTPGSEEMIQYMDAILDIIGNRAEDAHVNLREAFKDFPTLQTIAELVENAPEMIETAIYTVMTQPKKTAVWADALQSFSAFCNTSVDTIMTAAPGTGFDVAAYLGKLCSIDFDVLGAEMTSYQGFDRLNQIAIGNDTGIVNVTALLLKADRVLNSISYYYDNPLSTVTLNQRIFDPDVWEAMGLRIATWTNTTTTNYLSASTITQIFDLTFGPMLSQSPELQDAYNKAIATTSVLVDEVLMVIEASSLNKTFTGVPSLQKLFELANQLPELLETIVYTSVFHPEKLSVRTSSLVSFDAFCNAKSDDLFSVPPDSTFDLQAWTDKLCTIDFDEVEKDLANFKTAQNIEMIVNGSSKIQPNLTSVVEKIESLIQKLDEGATVNDRILNEDIWGQVLTRVEKWLGNYSLADSPLMSYDSIFQLLGQVLDSDPALKEELKPIFYVAAVVDNLMDTVLSLENKTHFGAADIFEGWTAMKSLIDLIQIPGVIDVFVQSSASEQFLSLFLNETSRADFCSPGTDASKYLKAQPKTKVDLQEIQTKFCEIDIDNFMNGFNKFFDTDKLMRVINGSEEIDLKKLQEKVNRFTQLVTVEWVENPPTFDLPQHFMNVSYWMNLFESNFDSYQEILMTKDQLESIVRQLNPILNMDGIREVGPILNSVLDILNENIASMENANYTLGNAISKIPALQNLFSSLGLDYKTMESLLLSPIKDPRKFSELLLSNNFQADFCTTNKWREVIDFPSDFNTSSLFLSVCQDDISPLLEKLKQSFDLETLVAALTNGYSDSQDWDKLVEKIYTLMDNINKLMDNPPSFTADETLKKLTTRYSNTTELWNMVSAFSALQQAFVNDTAFTGQFEGIFRVADVLVDFLDEMTARVKIQNGRLDLASLFRDVPEVVRIINGILDINPDPVTGFFAIQLRSDKVDDYIVIASNSTQLMNLVCDQTKFREMFMIHGDVNLTSLLTALCGLDFEPIAEKLSASFQADTIGDDVMNAWSQGGPFDAQVFMEKIENMIARITNLTTVDYIMFGKHDLGDLLMVNTSRLLEILNGQANGFQDIFTEDYVNVIAATLNNLLSSMEGQPDIKTFTAALRFIQTYLHSFNSFLRTIKDEPISLSVLLNNTEVGKIINPILSDRHVLDGIMNAKINIKKLSDMVLSPDPVSELCGDKLWDAIEVPTNESQALKDLQSSICSTNQTALIWQTIMLQANGYELNQQLNALLDELDQGRQSLNVTAVGEEMEELISLMETIIGQYLSGSRSLDDLLDVSSLQAVLDKAQRNIGQMLLDNAKSWSVDLADLVLPNIMDQGLLQNMAKTINSVNLIMGLTIEKLEKIKDGTISISTLFDNADDLADLIEAYIRVGKNVAQAWIDGEIDLNKMLNLFSDMTLVQSLCTQEGGVAKEISNRTLPSDTVKDLSTVICSIVDESITDDVQGFINYDEIGNQILLIWSSPIVTPDYAALANNVEKFTELIEEMARKAPVVSSSLTDVFDFSSTLQSLQNIAGNPKMIFSLMKILGVAIEEPLGDNQVMVRGLSGMNTFIIMPMIHVLEDLKSKGLSLENIANNPETLLDVLSTMVNFKVHYQVIETVLVKSQLNNIKANRDDICNNPAYENRIQLNGISEMTLPAPWRDIWLMLCNATDTNMMIQNMKDMGLTRVQMVAVLDKMSPVSNPTDLYNMYDRNFGWMDLMSSMENLTDLVTTGNVDQSGVVSMKSAWEAVKDILFDKSLKSFLSYLQIFESSASQDDGWIRFKQFLRFFSSSLKFVDENIEKLGNGTMVQLKDVLPDSDRVASLIQDVFGPSSAAELLTTFIDPIMFYRISMYDTWDEICKAGNPVTNYFHFPTGTDIAAVTVSLCNAVTNRTSSFQKLVSLFNAGDMLKQLDMLIQGTFNASEHKDTVWEAIYSSIRHLIDTAENLQNVRVDDSSVERWFTPIVNVLSALQEEQNSTVVKLCNTLRQSLINTEGYSEATPIISYVITSLNLVSDLTKLLPELDEMACIFANKTGLDIIGVVDKMTKLGLWKDLEKAIKEYISPLSELDCAAPLQISQTLMERINATVSNNGLDVHKMTQCLANTEGNFREMLSSLDQTISLIKDLLTIIQMPAIRNLIQNPSFMPVLHFIEEALNSEELLDFGDLLKDEQSAIAYLTNNLGLSQSFVDSFINATVNSDWAYLLEKPVQEVADILCNPDRLSKVIGLPLWSQFNVNETSSMICTGEVLDTVRYLKNISMPASDIQRLLSGTGETDLDALTNIFSAISDFIAQFADILKLATTVLTDFDIDILKDNTELIDELIQGNGLSDLGNSFHKILNNLAKIIPTSPVVDTVLRDIRRIVDGIIGLDILMDNVLEEIQVKDLVKDPQYLNFYLTTQLAFDSNISQAIMDGVFSSTVFLGIADGSNHTCDEVMDMLLIMNNTNVSVQDISNKICSLNEQQLETLLKALTPEVDIGSLITKYVTYTGDVVLKSTNMTADELDDMVEKIDKGIANLQEASAIIKNSENGTNLLNIFSGSTSAYRDMSKLLPTICGTGTINVFDTDFDTGIVITTPDNLAKSNELDEEDISDLPNDFCVDLYHTIRDSGMGNILWTYLKPIMRGKIPYTPDTVETRAIIAKANKTFETLREVHEVAKLWAEKTPNLMYLADAAKDTNDLRNALENDFVKGLVEATIGVRSSELISSLDALEADNFDQSQLESLQLAAEFVANYTSCITLDRFYPVESEEELEQEAFRLSRSKTFMAGIVFLNPEEADNSSGNVRKIRQANPGSSQTEIPKHIGYKIRMDVDNVMDTNLLKSPIWKMAAEDNFIEDLRYLRGFIFIQDMIDNAIIDMHKNEIYTTPSFKLKQMPFPCHHQDNFVFLLGTYFIPCMMTFVFMASLGIATHNLVYDKENGQEENLHVMGMIKGLNFISWLLSTMFLMTFVCIIISIMLKYTDTFIYSNPVIICLALVDFCFSSVMLLYMVSAFFTRTTIAILFVLIVYLISYMPYIVVVSMEIEMEFSHKTIACLASTTAFSFGSLLLAQQEENGSGVQWSNITEELDRDFSFSWACLMMLIDSAIYFLIGFYVRQVKPGKYGLSQPWYFPIKPSFWSSCFRTNRETSFASTLPQESNAGSLFEAPPEGYNVGIAIENISKTYSNKKRAVQNLTVSFYENQITSLLGHNGAAKTTTLKMICGVLEPTSGRVLINGSEPGCCAKNELGVCPQQNALFDYMSVEQHMEFYGGVKDSNSRVELLREIRKLLRDVDLWHARKIPVRDLSYGMKRRLCVALAFVGGSRTIVLDEPTSGVDPHARKNIWNLITSNRPGRTILLSTHHLDEADFLSDRIAVMHQGKLLCCGSPGFLKWSSGGGFKLTVAKMEQATQIRPGESQNMADSRMNSTNEAILTHIQSMSPEATLVDQTKADLTFNLPKDPGSMRVAFYQFFQNLDESSAQLGIESYGLSDTTLEEVFLKLTQKADDESDSGIDNPVVTSRDRQSTDFDMDQQPDLSHFLKPAARMQFAPTFGSHNSGQYFDEQSTTSVDGSKRRKGAALAVTQIQALVIKRFHHYRRNWRILISALCLPLLAFLIAMGFYSLRVDEGDMKELALDPSLYGPKSYSFFQHDARNVLSYSLVDTLKDSSVGVGTNCMRDWAQDYFKDNVCLAGTDWYNYTKRFYQIGCRNARQVYYDLGISQTYTILEKVLPSDNYLQDLEQQFVSGYLLRTFRDYVDKRFGGWSFEKSQMGSSSDVDSYVWFNTKAYHAMPSYFNSLSNVVLRSLLPDGKSPADYGITTLSHPIKLGKAALTMKTLQDDAGDAGIAVMIVIALSFIPGGFILYLINEKVQKERQLQNISGISFLTYWLVAYIWDLLMYSIAVGLAVIVVVIFQPDAYYIRDNLSAFALVVFLYGWAIIPCMYCLARIFNNASTAYLVSFCINLFLALVTVISLLVMQMYRDTTSAWKAYKICKYAFLIFPQYSLGQALMDMVSNTVIYKLFIRFGEDRYVTPYDTDLIGWHMIALFCEGLFFFILTLVLDGIKSPVVSLPKDQISHKSIEEDEDVIRERERIQSGAVDDMLIVDNLSKVYRRGWKKVLAVNHVSFAVPEGECFGLLGVNGAGKTSTFRMLTGDSRPAAGTSSLKGHKMSHDDRSFGQDVGYCPQEGGLDEYLTGEEMLYFHARLRGFNSEQTKEIVSDLLAKLQLTPYAKKAVNTYSGGTKRKLTLAVALLGDPPILYLDEPTTGMDAGTRRLAWKCIAQANRNGQSVVLTSHSMDECDALCSTIAIMVNGQIKCIGSPQHLKHKFGGGYIVMIHADHSQLTAATQSFLSSFPGTILKAKHHNSVELLVPQASGRVADILAMLQRSQANRAIEYYSLSQTTLDAVFVMFAEEQSDNFEEDISTSGSGDSSSGAKNDSQSGSVSSNTPPSSSNGNGRKNPDSKYVFTNPEFIEDPPEVSFPLAPQGQGHYVSNIAIGSQQRQGASENHYVTKL